MPMPKKPVEKASPAIDIIALNQADSAYCLLGTSPLCFNQMSEKGELELLIPKGMMNSAARRANLKHDPIEEYRSSVYRRADYEKGPTRLRFPAGAIKQAMAAAALDLPDIAKTQVQRLTWTEGDWFDVYGIPEIKMGIVRLNGQNRSPDVHTWAILRHWAAIVTVRWVEPQLSKQNIANLLGNAGMIIGIGDGRQEKGHFSYGQWDMVEYENEDFQKILNEGTMAAQDAALANPGFFDGHSETLFHKFNEEYARRGRNLRGEKTTRTPIGKNGPPMKPPAQALRGRPRKSNGGGGGFAAR